MSLPCVWDMNHLYAKQCRICMQDPTRILMREMTDSYVRHDSLVCVWYRMCEYAMTHSHANPCCIHLQDTLRIHMWDIAHLYVRHDSFVRETWVICMYDITQSRGTWICDVPHLYRHLHRCYMCDMTPSYVRHDSIVCATSLNHDGHEFVTWLIHINICVVAICVTWLNLMNTWVAAMCVILLDHTQHETFIRVIWRMRTCGMTRLYVWVDSWCASRVLPCVCEVTQSCVWWPIPCDMNHCDMP